MSDRGRKAELLDDLDKVAGGAVLVLEAPSELDDDDADDGEFVKNTPFLFERACSFSNACDMATSLIL